MHDKLAIFISSKGLKEQRDAVESTLEALDVNGSRFEKWPSTPNDPIKECLLKVETSDAMILLLGRDYGDIIKDGLSATHLEYRHARAINLPIFVFIIKSEKIESKQLEFIIEVNKEQFHNVTINNTAELVAAVNDSLRQEFARCFKMIHARISSSTTQKDMKQIQSSAIDNVKEVISEFEMQNPGLNLKINYAKDVINYEIKNAGSQPVDLGKLTVYGDAKEKLIKLIDEGEEVTFIKGEYRWESAVKGMPSSDNIEESLQIRPEIKFKPIDGRLIAVRKGAEGKFLATKLTVISMGRRRIKARISGAQFLGKIDINFDYLSGEKPESIFEVKYNNPDIINLRHTIDFLTSLSKGDLVRFIANNTNEVIFGFVVNTVNNIDAHELLSFMDKMTAVFTHFNIQFVPFQTLSMNDIKTIDILHAFLQKKSVYEITTEKFSIRGDVTKWIEQLPEIEKEYGTDYALTVTATRKYSLLDRTIDIGNHEMILEGPTIIKESIKQDGFDFICKRVVFDFTATKCSN